MQCPRDELILSARYDCKDCGGTFSGAEMSKGRGRSGQLDIYPRCLPCSAARKRRLEREVIRAEDGSIIEPVKPPDPWPAALLRELLHDSRRVGLDFDAAWAEDFAFALRFVRGPNARSAWRAAFEGTRAAWEAAYNRVDGPGQQLTQTLAETPEGERLPISPLAA